MFIAIAILVLWYFANAVLSLLAGTCTMGDTDTFLGGALMGLPAAVIALALLLRARTRRRWEVGVVLTTAALEVIVLCLWIPLAYSAGFRGHHLCGAEYDGYLGDRSLVERLVPLAHVAVAIAVLVSGSRSIQRKARGPIELQGE
jgi:hypothetical protein